MFTYSQFSSILWYIFSKIVCLIVAYLLGLHFGPSCPAWLVNGLISATFLVYYWHMIIAWVKSAIASSSTMRSPCSWVYRKLMVSYSNHVSWVTAFRTVNLNWVDGDDSSASRYRGNPHAFDATIRSRAGTFIDKVLAQMGRTHDQVYDVQKGTSDNIGSSLIYDPVDVLSDHNSLVKGMPLRLIDVDYYLDMSDILSRFEPTILYSQVPHAAQATAASDGHTYYIQDNTVHYEAHCGYAATHGLWNYGVDYLHVCYGNWLQRTLGFTATYHYRVLRRSFSTGRAVIMLIPHHRVPWYGALFSGLCKRFELRRHKLNFPGVAHGWSAFEVFTEKGPYVTFAAEGPYSHPVQVRRDIFCKAVDVARHCRTKPSEHSIYSLTNRKDTLLLAEFALDCVTYGHKLDTFHLGLGPVELLPCENDPKCPCQSCKTVREPSDSLDYKLGPHNTTDLPSSSVSVASTSVVVDAAVLCPVRDSEAAKVAISGRVAEMQKAAEKNVDAAFVRSKIQPFVNDLFKRIKVSNPLTEEQVLARVKPMAREALAIAYPQQFISSIEPYVKSFIKAETYAKLTAPRVIQPLDSKTTAELFKFSYALQDALHNLKCFAFGRPPSALAQSISEASARGLTAPGVIAVEMDYSRYDGTITGPMREVELAVYKAAFPMHVRALDEIHRSTYGRAAMLVGQAYTTGHSRLSGSPDTCLMNSILNMFALYCHLGPRIFDETFVGGDDTLAFVKESEVTSMVKSIERCGLIVKVQKRSKQEPFLFLSRYFNWATPNSCADIARALPKLHVLNHANIPKKFLEPRFYMKLACLANSDRNTPILGKALIRKMVELESRLNSKQLTMKLPDQLFTFWELFLLTQGPWPNNYEPWMDKVANQIEELTDGVYSMRRSTKSPFVLANDFGELPTATEVPYVPKPTNLVTGKFSNKASIIKSSPNKISTLQEKPVRPRSPKAPVDTSTTSSAPQAPPRPQSPTLVVPQAACPGHVAMHTPSTSPVPPLVTDLRLDTNPTISGNTDSSSSSVACLVVPKLPTPLPSPLPSPPSSPKLTISVPIDTPPATFLYQGKPLPAAPNTFKDANGDISAKLIAGQTGCKLLEIKRNKPAPALNDPNAQPGQVPPGGHPPPV